MTKLGKIEPVNVREVWKDEAREFTPWLSREEGLQLLGNELGVELELVSVERRAGSYKADIVAKIQDENESEEHIVVIENQLESTDHDHLGKIITYAAGHNAVYCVWIAPTFSDDHRQAIDWLNEHMNDIAFFGLEISVKRIGDSMPAPMLKIISSPNEWTRAVRGGAKNKGYSEVKLDQLKFWEELKEYVDKKKDKGLQLSRAPKARHWYDIAVGRSGFKIALSLNSILSRAGCEIYIRHDNDKKVIDQLLTQKNDIETQLGYQLDWQRLPDKMASRIVVYKNGSIENESERQELIDWLYQRACDFHKVFSPKIQNIHL